MDSETCRYDARHQSQHVPAVTTIDGGAVASRCRLPGMRRRRPLSAIARLASACRDTE